MMKNRFVMLQMGVFFWGMCVNFAAHGQSVLEVRFVPPFMFKSTLTIKQTARGKSTLRLDYENKQNRVRTTKVKIPTSALDSLNNFMPTFIFRKKGSVETTYRIQKIEVRDTFWINNLIRSKVAELIGKDSVKIRMTRVGLDGMTTGGSYEINGTKKTFESWSPGRGSPEHQLSRILHGLMLDHIKAPSAIRYIEDLHYYLELGTGLHLLSKKPLIWKWFGTFADDVGNIERFKLFFEELPTDAPCYFDFTRFKGIDERGRSQRVFKTFIDEYPQVYIYRPSASVREQFRMINIPPERIVKKIPRARWLRASKEAARRAK